MGAEEKSPLMRAYHEEIARRAALPKLTPEEEIRKANQKIADYFASLHKPKVITFDDIVRDNLPRGRRQKESPAPEELQESFQLRFR